MAGCGDAGVPMGSPDLSVTTCQLTLTLCDRECVDTGADKRHCGMCDHACDPGYNCVKGACKLTCDVGLTACFPAAICTNLQTDPNHCGACGTVCAPTEVCEGGRCATSCGNNLANCSRSCVDLSSDRDHCGGCANLCPPGQACGRRTRNRRNTRSWWE